MSNNAVLQKLMRSLINRWFPNAKLVATADQDSALGINGNYRPDIVMLEMSMSTPGDLRFVQNIRAANPAASMLMLSDHPYLACYDEIIPKGISGYFDIASDTFVDDIHRCVVYIAESKISENIWRECEDN